MKIIYFTSALIFILSFIFGLLFIRQVQFLKFEITKGTISYLNGNDMNIISYLLCLRTNG
jgi:hypothetical protein